MWSTMNANSKNDINYLTECCKQGECIPTNVIRIIELFFEEFDSNNVRREYSIQVCILADAKQVLSEQDIIKEVCRIKAPNARFLGKKDIYKR